MAVKIEMEVVIAPDGSIRLTIHGLKGAECENETKAVERALGRVRKRTRTREYYEQRTGSTVRIQKK